MRAASASQDESVRVWADVRVAFATELEPHFIIEEQLLLPALAKCGRQDLVERTRADHGALRNLLDAEDRDLAALLSSFAELLTAHVRFEERELFNAAQELLDAAALDAIAAAHS